MNKQSFLDRLEFDKELVSNLKQTVSNNHILYNYLISGKISLKEYVALVHQ